MTALLRRKITSLVLAGAIATIGLLMVAPAASALPPVGGEGAGVICKWGNEEYSPGGVKVSNGRKYECQPDGSWKDVGPARKRGKRPVVSLPQLPVVR